MFLNMLLPSAISIVILPPDHYHGDSFITYSSLYNKPSKKHLKCEDLIYIRREGVSNQEDNHKKSE